jgi:hypothetical protein
MTGNNPLEVCKLDCWKEECEGNCFSSKMEEKRNKTKNEEILKITKLNIKYDKLDGRPSIDFYIKDREVHCLLDTGARVNVIELSLIKNIPNTRIRESRRRLACANASELINYGTVLLKIKIEGSQKNIKFYVVKGMNPEMIAL